MPHERAVDVTFILGPPTDPGLRARFDWVLQTRNLGSVREADSGGEDLEAEC